MLGLAYACAVDIGRPSRLSSAWCVCVCARARARAFASVRASIYACMHPFMQVSKRVWTRRWRWQTISVIWVRVPPQRGGVASFSFHIFFIFLFLFLVGLLPFIFQFFYFLFLFSLSAEYVSLLNSVGLLPSVAGKLSAGNKIAGLPLLRIRIGWCVLLQNAFSYRTCSLIECVLS